MFGLLNHEEPKKHEGWRVDVQPFGSARPNQREDLAAAVWVNEFACQLRCGLCGFRQRNHSLLTESLILSLIHDAHMDSKWNARAIPMAEQARSAERGRGCVQTCCWFEKQPLTKRKQSGTDGHSIALATECTSWVRTLDQARPSVGSDSSSCHFVPSWFKKNHPKRPKASMNRRRPEQASPSTFICVHLLNEKTETSLQPASVIDLALDGVSGYI